MDNHRSVTRLLALVLFGLLLALLLLFADPAIPIAHAVCSNTITVSNTNDTGAGSLRDATLSVCSGGTINFAVSGTIHLNSNLSNPVTMTIAALTQTITLDGGHNVVVFNVIAGTTLTISNLTIANGQSGFSGGIANGNGSRVNISNVTFFGNATEGGLNGGGAIINLNGGVMNISGSIFYSNTAAFGGGIINYSSTITIANSTFYGNYSSNSGAAIYTYSNSDAKIINSTIYGNISSGGAVYVQDPALTLTNTIVANTIGVNCGGIAILDGGHNLRYPAADASCVGTSGDPKLAPLGNYGGPTQTAGLFIGSAAIDAGDNAVCAAVPVDNKDQRGYPRPVNGTCDIGAFEGTLRPLYLPLILK